MRRLILAGRSRAAVAEVAATGAGGHDCPVEPVALDATRVPDVAPLLAGRMPDLVVQCAAGCEAIAFNQQMGRGDGADRIDDDGTVHSTPACRAAVAAIAPDLGARAARLDDVLGRR